MKRFAKKGGKTYGFSAPGIAVLAAIIALPSIFLFSCGEIKELSSEASIAQVTVAGTPVTLGTGQESWLAAKNAANAGSVYITVDKMTGAKVVASGPQGATIYLAKAKPEVAPWFVEETEFDFEPLDYLWVEVFSENADACLLYAIQVRTSTPVVTDVTLGGRSAVGGTLAAGRPIQQYGKGLGDYGASLEAATAGEVWYAKEEEGTDLALTITAEDSASKLSYCTSTTDNSAASYTAYDSTTTQAIKAENGHFLLIKSESADSEHGDTVYYKLRLVSKETGLGVSDVKINGVSFTVGSMGTTSWGGGENRSGAANLASTGGYLNIGTTGASVTIAVGTKDTGVTLRYAHSDWDRAAETPSVGHTTLVYQESNVLTNLPTGEFIAVEATNALGNKGWYSFRIAVGAHSDITSLSVGGEAVTLADARNDSASGTVFAVYRPSTRPSDANSDGLWDSLAISASGNASGNLEVGVASAASGVPAEWTSLSAGSVTLTNKVSTSSFVVLHMENEDGLDYYYKVRVLYGSSEAALTEVAVATSAGAITVTQGAVGSPLSTGTWGYNTGGTGSAELTAAQAGDGTGITITGTAGTGATVLYDWGGVGFGALIASGAWKTEGKGAELFAGGSLFYGWVNVAAGVNNAYVLIQVTSEDKSVQNVYAIKFTVK